jgi:hypothetical protein
LFVLLAFVILAQSIIVVVTHRNEYFNRNYHNQFESLKRLYYSSQYTQKKPTAIISDEVFESFSGGVFLKGMNPIHIVHDHPPLGRYIVSLSILLFDNAQTIMIFLMITTYTGIFLVGLRVIKSWFFALIPVAIFANEPLIINKLIHAPSPEPIQLPFIIFAFYFFMLAIGSKKKVFFYFLASLMLGFVISTRFFVTGLAILGVWSLYLFVLKKNIEDLIKLYVVLPISLVVLILSYTRTMMDGYSVVQIIGIQKYILAYHKSAFVHAFSYWDLLLFNRWHTWWGDQKILSDPQWIVLWPISLAMGLIAYLWAFVKKLEVSDEGKITILWFIAFSVMLSTGYTSTRYFLPVLPFMYVIAVAGAKCLILHYGIIKKK